MPRLHVSHQTTHTPRPSLHLIRFLSPFPKPFYSSKGAGLGEFGILVGLVAILSIGAVIGLGDQIKNQFNTTAESVASGAALERTAEVTPPAPEEPLAPLPTFTGAFTTPVATAQAPQFVIANTLQGDVVTLTIQINADTPIVADAVTLTLDEQPVLVPMSGGETGTVTISADIQRGTQQGSITPVTAPILTFSVVPDQDIFTAGETNTAVIPESLSGDVVGVYTTHNSGQETYHGQATLNADAGSISIPLGNHTSGSLSVRFELTRDTYLLADDLVFDNLIVSESFYVINENIGMNSGYGVGANFSDIFTLTQGYQTPWGLTSFDKFTGDLNWHVPTNVADVGYTGIVATENHVALTTRAGIISIHRTSDGQIVHTLPPSNYLRGMAFDPANPNMFYAISRDRRLERLDITTGQYQGFGTLTNEAGQLIIHNGIIYGMNFANQRIYSANTSNPYAAIQASSAPTDGIPIQMDHDSTHIYTLSSNGRVCRFAFQGLARNESCQPITIGTIENADGIDKFFVQDGKIYIGQAPGQGIRVFEWNSSNGAPLVFLEHLFKTGAEAFNANTFGNRFFVDDDGLYAGHHNARRNNITTGGVWFVPH